MKKIFFFDIDETLLPLGDEGISIENIEAIKKLSQIHDVYIATGKSINMAQDVLDQLDLKNSITSNGAVITENNKIIYSKHLEKNDINDIYNLVKHNDNILLGGQGNNGSYIIDTNNKHVYDKYVIDLFTNLSVDIPKVVTDFEENIFQLWLIGDDLDSVNIKNQKFDTFRWHENGIDIVYKNMSKAQAIQFLLQTKYKNEKVITYAFGDSLNDISMFKIVDIAVAVSNAKDELKKIANYIADNSENKGIYNFLTTMEII